MLIITLIKAIVKKIPLSVWITLGVLTAWVGSAFWAYHSGQGKVQSEWNASIARGKESLRNLKSRQVTVNMVVDTIYKERVVTIKEKSRARVEQIPVVIPDYRTELSDAFRVFHDLSASGQFPFGTGGATASPVSVGTVASTVDRNYTQCLIWRESLIAWQAWYRQQYELYQEPSS